MDRRYPAERGYSMPAEWSPHAATFLSWPHNTDTWPQNLQQAQAEFTQLVAAIAKDEMVYVLAQSELHEDIAKRVQLGSEFSHRLKLLDVPTNDAWIRDYGPTLVSDGSQLVGIDWKYNAWGGKYPPFDDDQKCVSRLLDCKLQFERFASKVCLEGGAIEIDDNAVAMCTRSCALDPNRNSISELEIQTELEHCLGAQKVIWLTGDAIAGDDTDGHIDQLARFVPGARILHAMTSRSDPQYDALEKNRCDLIDELDRLGLHYELIELQLPDPVTAFGNRLPASYCNFYITNASVIVPTYGQSKDDTVVGTIANCFPDRKVIGLPSIHLSVGLGSFHCLTQQMPDFAAFDG